MARQGVVSHLVDDGGNTAITAATGGANDIPGPEWVADLRALKPDGVPLLIRAPITADRNDQVRSARIAQGLAAYAAAGMEVIPVLHQGFAQPWTSKQGADRALWSPNAPLSLQGPQYGPTGVNHFIQEYSLKAAGLCRQLVPAGLARIWCWNEPNLQQIIPIGANVPPADSGKSPALAPEIFMVLLYQTALRCKAAGVHEVYAGALSCLVRFLTNPHGPWLAGYLDKGYKFLAAHGVHAPYPWSALSVNMEGVVTEAYAAAVAREFRTVAAKYGDHPRLVVGEWGYRQDSYNHIDAATAFHALDRNTDEMYFFSHPHRNQQDPGDYGTIKWSTKDGHFMPGTRCPWWVFLRDAYAGKL